jgi:hypothetical protein
MNHNDVLVQSMLPAHVDPLPINQPLCFLFGKSQLDLAIAGSRTGANRALEEASQSRMASVQANIAKGQLRSAHAAASAEPVPQGGQQEQEEVTVLAAGGF